MVRGWSGTEDVPLFPTLPLEEALSTSWATDAHCVPYVVRGPDGLILAEIPRVNLPGFEALVREGCEVVYEGLIFDLDCPEAHSGAVAEAPPIWREDLADQIGELPLDLRPAVVYGTKRGARLVYPFSDSVPAPVFRLRWAGMAERLRAEGIEVDHLTDLTRCYRLPDVLRDGSRKVYGPHVRESSRTLPASLLAALALPTPTEAGDRPFAGLGAVAAPLRLEGQITSNRNVTLTRVGGRLRAMGLEAPEILATLRTIAETRCDGWTPAPGELEHISRSVSRYEAAPLVEAVTPKAAPLVEGDLRFVLGSEAELARAAAAELEVDGVPMVYDRGSLYRYSGASGIWAPLEGSVVRAKVAEWDGEWIGTGERNKDDSIKVKPLRVSASLTSGVLELVEVFRAGTGYFDEAGDGLSVSNGFVRVSPSGVELLPFAADQRSTASLPYRYVAGAVPVRFIAALEACWSNEFDSFARIDFLRQFIGAALLGLATRYQKGVILVGEGANGKSTILEAISGLFGPGLVTAIPPQELGQEYRRAMLAGARLNVVSELPETEILLSEAVKAVLTGDTITARAIREAPFTFRPVAAHLFAANDLPGVRDMSHGFWRRWVVLPFTREFSEAEQDRGLGAALRDEREAIASWAIEGAVSLVAAGCYSVPASSDQAVSEWRSVADVVSRFVAERTVRTDSPRTKAADLYSAFQRWANENGHPRSLSSVNFGKRLKKLGVISTRKTDGIFYSLATVLVAVDNFGGM